MYLNLIACKLKSVSIGSSVNSIGTEAFHDCFELENVSFEKESKLTTIGDNAFSNCKKLQLISIPSSVNSNCHYNQKN